MNSEEFGLVAAQQLLQCEDLHYGYWDKDLPVTLNNLSIAQHKHTQVLLEAVIKNIKPMDRLLDVGCGIGTIMEHFLQQGLMVDGLVPSAWMTQQTTKRLTPAHKTTVYCSTFQDFDVEQLLMPYDLVFF